jgi:hypothetical protein
MVSILPQGGDSGRVPMLNREAWHLRLPVRGASIGLCLVLSACGIHWPWRHRPPAAPAPVQELSIEAPGAPILQFWDRNALLLDLTGVAAEGAATLQASPARGWPIRIEFRVQPGRFAQLEVQGRQRVVFEVPAQGGPLVLKLGPGAYARDTAQITLRWSAADDSAH